MLHWLALQIIAMEFFLPWSPDRPFYLTRYARHSNGIAFGCISVFSWALIAAVTAIRLHETANEDVPTLPRARYSS